MKIKFKCFKIDIVQFMFRWNGKIPFNQYNGKWYGDTHTTVSIIFGNIFLTFSIKWREPKGYWEERFLPLFK